MTVYALSTIDNPYNPLTDFEHWIQYDMLKGYNSCAYLSRVAKTSGQLSDQLNDEEIERAIDSIVINDALNRYIKVTAEVREGGLL